MWNRPAAPGEIPLAHQGLPAGGLDHGKKRTMFNKLNNPCLTVHILMTGLRG
ncbi:hypothetical protein [Azospirillum largimobile]